MANRSSILWVLPRSVSTLWFMLVAWLRSTLLLHLTRSAFAAVESLQVGWPLSDEDLHYTNMIIINSLLFLYIYCKGLGATLNVAKPKKGSTVAIFGLGAVGLAVSSLLTD